MKSDPMFAAASALFTGVMLLLVTPAASAPLPVIDGNLADLRSYALDLKTTGAGYGGAFVDAPDGNGNPLEETVYSDAKFIPCPSPQPPLDSHWTNGFEIFEQVIAYVPGTTTLYLGLRTEGAIGDTDGNDDPDLSGGQGCNPEDNIDESPGVSGTELYVWRFDLNCDGTSDSGFRFENNALTGYGQFAGAIVEYAYRKNAAAGADGHGLEMAIHLSAPLPLGFRFNGVQANAFDGLTEDSAQGINFSPNGGIEAQAHAVPAAICPGGVTRLSFAISNTGQAPLTVLASGTLPASLVYAGNPASECGAGPPTNDAGALAWPPFDLAPGTVCALSFDVTGGPGCAGDVLVPFFAEGDFSSICLDGGLLAVTTEASASVTCGLCPGEACPRTPGFWNAQCAQMGNGSTKFTRAQVTSIAECIDDRSAFFNWTSGTDFDQFCRTITPPKPMDQRKQAKRQFACLLANVCTDQLNLQPSRGGEIYLDPSTAVHCDGFEAGTIGELIDEVDALLVGLEGESLNDADVKAKYAAIIGCCDGINNGLTIAVAPGCEDGGAVPTGADGEAAPSVELYRPMPNPFSGTTSFSYMVSGPDAAGVEITVYDVAGRQIRKLVGGEQTAGIHTATWDGKNDQGAQVQRGVYFVRTVIAGHKESTNRILYLTNGR